MEGRKEGKREGGKERTGAGGGSGRVAEKSGAGVGWRVRHGRVPIA